MPKSKKRKRSKSGSFGTGGVERNEVRLRQRIAAENAEKRALAAKKRKDTLEAKKMLGVQGAANNVQRSVPEVPKG